MKNIFFISSILISLAVINLWASDLTITYPPANTVLCNDGNSLRVSWNYTGSDDFLIRIIADSKIPILLADSIPVHQGSADVGVARNFVDVRNFNLVIQLLKTGTDLAEVDKITVYNRPVIHDQSVVTQVCKGHPLKLYVLASGDYLSVEWYKNGKLIPGANDITLWLIDPDTKDNGIYKCVLTSYPECGSVESKEMKVFVNDGPDVVADPQNIPFVQGRAARFRARFHLTPEDEKHVKFRWWRDTTFNYISYVNQQEISRLDTLIVPIYDGPKFAGTESDLLSVKMTTVWDKVNYYCEAITDWGCTFSKPARVLDWFELLTVQNEFEECAGNNGMFIVEPVGIDSNIVQYQWYTIDMQALPEGEKFIGTKTRFLSIINAQLSDAGQYICRIKDPSTGYMAVSDICYLNVKEKPIIHQTSGDYLIKDHNNVLPGTINLWVNVANNQYNPCNFEWFKAGKKVGPSCNKIFRCAYWPFYTDSKGNIDYSQPRTALTTDTGNYVCHIWNECGEVWTDTMRVNWGYDDVTMCAGSDALLKVDKYKGSDDYDYYWTKNNVRLTAGLKYSGTNTNALTISNCGSYDSGDYYVTAVKKSDSTEYPMGKIFLNINTGPTFNRAPDDTVNSLHDFYSHNQFEISYKVGFSYQLYNDNGAVGLSGGVKASGNISQTYTYTIRLYDVYIPASVRDNLPDGLYKMKAWNDCGTAWSKAFYYKKETNSIKPAGTAGDVVGSDNSNNNSDGESGITGIRDLPRINTELTAYPNPSADGTTIEWFGFGENDTPVVEVYNSFGSKITDLPAQGLSGRGAAEFYWNGKDASGERVPTGLYFAKITSGGLSKTVGIMISR